MTFKEIAVSQKGKPTRLILRNHQSPGDIVMLTAAVRDLHRYYPNRFQTDVRTPCPSLWENNPYITPLKESDPSVQIIECEYPLIHQSNREPWHFIHGFTRFLSDILKLEIKPTDFKGDIHLTDQERGWISQIQEITVEPVPFWIIAAGGKRDFTIKWWSTERFQAVVDHFRKRVLFVQIGEVGHAHPPLRGVVDLRGRTDLRQLVRLVYHAQGVVCPVSLPMHLAAAIETCPGMPRNRPCVVVAGGREPSQWEAYPHHQFIHTNGALFCCDAGGCWKSRTVPLGDGDEKDKAENLCVNVVTPRSSSNLAGPPLTVAHKNKIKNKNKNALQYPRKHWSKLIPRCMDMIEPNRVIRAIEMYFMGGAVRYLKPSQATICRSKVRALGWTGIP